MSTETPTPASGEELEQPDAAQPQSERMLESATPEAGWYTDPNADSQLRWWNGTAWTDAIRPDDGVDVEPGTVEAKPPARRRLVLAGVGVLGIGAVAVFAAAALGSREITVDFSIDVDKACYDTSFGYGDFDDGTVVTVASGSGDVLGVGLLDGSPVGYRCVYSAEFPADPSEDGIYVVTAGNGNRGELTYTDSDIEDGVLTVFAELG